MIVYRTFRAVALSCLTIPLLLAATCPPTAPAPSPVTITFEQIGACNGYQQTTGPGGSGPHTTISAGPKAAFVAFRILRIDNSQNGSDFNFDPERIFINERPTEHVSTSLS